MDQVQFIKECLSTFCDFSRQKYYYRKFSICFSKIVRVTECHGTYSCYPPFSEHGRLPSDNLHSWKIIDDNISTPSRHNLILNSKQKDEIIITCEKTNHDLVNLVIYSNVTNAISATSKINMRFYR